MDKKRQGFTSASLALVLTAFTVGMIMTAPSVSAAPPVKICHVGDQGDGTLIKEGTGGEQGVVIKLPASTADDHKAAHGDCDANPPSLKVGSPCTC